MNYDYCGMLNWTSDVPECSMIIFKNILELLRNHEQPKILEVGTFAGTSICTMIDILPNSVATAVDNWSLDELELDGCRWENKSLTMSDVKSAFLKNSNGRVELIESDSTHVLMQFIKEDRQFDFIYVDGSHTSLDTVLDIVLAWMLLPNGGILGIDDYLYTPPGTQGTPRDAVDCFLKKFKDEYVILSKDYRIFLQKRI